MKITIGKSALQTALNVVSKGVASKTHLPYLAGVLMRAKGDEVVFETTDLNISFRYKTQASVEDPGSTLISARKLTDITKSLPDAAITIETENDKAQIVCCSSRFNLPTLAYQDFPAFPSVEEAQTFEIGMDVFSDCVSKTSFAVSHDDEKPELMGVYIEGEDHELNFVATDGYRFVKNTIVLGDVPNVKAVVPVPFLKSAVALPGSGDAKIGICGGQIIIDFGDTTIVSRIINHAYVGYARFFEEEMTSSVRFRVNQLMSAICRAVAVDSGGSPAVRLDFCRDDNSIQVTRDQKADGYFCEIIEAIAIEGYPPPIMFSCSFMLDALSAFAGEVVSIDLTSQTNRPIYLNSVIADEDVAQFVAPIRLDA